MSDFKIGDEIEEFGSTPKRKKTGKLFPIIIVIIVSLLIGAIVFFGSSALFVKKEEVVETPTKQKLSLNDENVEILYQYVTYGTRNKRNDKFISSNIVKIDDFTNEEKFYYALQFAQVEDFVYSGKLTDNNDKIYTISEDKIETYMKRFFGGKVSYKKDCVISSYAFSFRINGQNVGTLTYSKEDKGYNTIFDGFEDNYVSTEIVEPYYTKLSEATENEDGTIELTEKIIYTELKQEENGLYTLTIYKDYSHNNAIETKQNLTLEQLKANPIDIKDYEKKASTIRYRFDLDFKSLYFAESTILN